jgi:NAD(P)-dependent dehydrogenase (short-subunit alcohol dehydrogenase family)
VLVTGASKGIGEACALRLARAGYRVFAGVRAAADGERLRAAGLTPVPLDITDPGQVEAAARFVAAETGAHGLAGLVNNAGIAVAGPLEFLPVSALRHQLEINVIGQVAVTQAVLPALRRARGRIVFIGSVSGRSALPFTGAYAASKYALEAITDALRIELMPWGLHVSIVEPGVIATPIWDTSLALGEELIASMPPSAVELYGSRLDGLRKRALRGRSGRDPDDVAQAVEHALSARRPRTRYLVGMDARLRILFLLLPTRLRDRIIAEAVKRL